MVESGKQEYTATGNPMFVGINHLKITIPKDTIHGLNQENKSTLPLETQCLLE